MSRFLKTSVAAFALSAIMGMPLASFAQTAAPDAAAPVAEAQAQAPLPKALADLNLQDVRTKSGKRDGQRVSGKLADGTELKAMVDAKGELRGAFVERGKALPEALATTLVPQAVSGQDIFKQFATIGGVMSGEKGVMLFGQDSNGENLRAGFSTDGTLMRFGRGDDGRGPGFDGKDRGDKQGKRHGDRHGDKHGGPKGERPAPVSDDQARGAAEKGGYTDLGDITREGPRTYVAAKNPQGEAVKVEIGRKGDVVREIAQ